MKFDFKRRSTEFGVFRNRREKEQQGTEVSKLKAIDIPVRHRIKPKELDMLVPTQGTPLSEFLFGPDLRKPALQCPLLFPIKVYRKPEHLKVSIYDDGVDKRKVMTFADCRVETPMIECDGDADSLFLTYKIEIHPGNQLQRISDNVEAQVCDYECKATQPELFDENKEDDEGEEGGSDGQQGGQQVDLMSNPDEQDDDD